MKKLALLDGDVFAYNAAASTEVETNWGDGLWTLHSEFDDAMRHAENHMQAVRKEIGADRIVFVWSCPTRRYWRHDIFPEYKGGRRVLTARAPLALPALKLQLADEYESYMKPNLEGDDVLGILATASWYEPDAEKIIVSIDKDMKTIPGGIFNPDKDYQPWVQSPEEAHLYWLSQALGGDMTDGYPGAKGISPESAAAFLRDPYEWERFVHTFKSGPRKGLEEERWRKVEPTTRLNAMLSLYAKGGSEDPMGDYIRNGLCARILQADEYDWEREEVLVENIKEKLCT